MLPNHAQLQLEPAKYQNKYGTESIYAAAPTPWNTLPVSIRQFHQKHLYQNGSKTSLFQNCYLTTRPTTRFFFFIRAITLRSHHCLVPSWQCPRCQPSSNRNARSPWQGMQRHHSHLWGGSPELPRQISILLKYVHDGRPYICVLLRNSNLIIQEASLCALVGWWEITYSGSTGGPAA